MFDVLTPTQRSRCMAAIRSKNTKPEIAVRRVAFGLGYRFRLHVRELPGTPDLVFPRLRKVINVSGCFWHLHACGRCRIPAVRRSYWLPKLLRNQQRDRTARRALNRRGWRVLTIWECQTKDLPRLSERVARFLAD
jgi:DNA mismatch endonuclease (patch repair protein)